MRRGLFHATIPRVDEWDPILWHRQPCDETERRWCAWLLYLELPRPRAMAAVARAIGVSVLTAERWSRLGYWRERAAAWDAPGDARELDARHEAVSIQRAALARQRPVQDAQGDILYAARELIARALTKHLAIEDEAEMPSLDIRDLSRLMAVALPQERLLAGGVSERVGHAIELSGVSDEDLATLERILISREA